MHFSVPLLAGVGATLTNAHLLPRATTGNFTLSNAVFTTSSYTKSVGTTT